MGKYRNCFSFVDTVSIARKLASLNVAGNPIMEIGSSGLKRCAFVCDWTFMTNSAIKLEIFCPCLSICWRADRNGSLKLSHSFSLQSVKQEVSVRSGFLYCVFHRFTRVGNDSVSDGGGDLSGLMDLAQDQDECFWLSWLRLCLRGFLLFDLYVSIVFPCLRTLCSVDVLDDDGVTRGTGNETSATFLISSTLLNCSLTFS